MQYRKLEAVSAGVPGQPDLMDIRQEGMTSNVCTAREPYATLFAAAPDMLAAAEEVVDELVHMLRKGDGATGLDYAYEKLVATIGKATAGEGN